MGTDKAGSGKQPGGQEVTAPRLAVVLGRPADASRICRLDAPCRVLRIWALLNRADGELHQASLPPGAAARLQRQLDAVTGELGSGRVSPRWPLSCTTSSAGEGRCAHGGRTAGGVREPAGLDRRPGDRDAQPDGGGQRKGHPVRASHPSRNRSVRGSGLTAAGRPRRSRASRRRNAASAGLMVTGTGVGERSAVRRAGSQARLCAQRCLAPESGSGGWRRVPWRMTGTSSGSCPRGAGLVSQGEEVTVRAAVDLFGAGQGGLALGQLHDRPAAELRACRRCPGKAHRRRSPSWCPPRRRRSARRGPPGRR